MSEDKKSNDVTSQAGFQESAVNKSDLVKPEGVSDKDQSNKISSEERELFRATALGRGNPNNILSEAEIQSLVEGKKAFDRARHEELEKGNVPVTRSVDSSPAQEPS